jgi:hypothetical protein
MGVLIPALFACTLLLPAVALAAPWAFTDAAELAAPSPGIFHHLESSGRRNLAVSGDHLAITWEDDRDGVPRIYSVTKKLADQDFSEPLRMSGDGEAFEPTIAALGEGRFAVAWEEDGQLRLRTLAGTETGPILNLSGEQSAQPSLAYAEQTLYLTAAESEGRFSRIRLHRLAIDGDGALRQIGACPVDGEPLQNSQLYPTLALQQGRLVVAWEDRRPGHTIIMAAESSVESPCDFSGPLRISEEPEGAGDLPYGSGHGVARVALAAYGERQILAAWADKRNFREGYDIFAAHWQAGEGFGANQMVQDPFGGMARQWHAAIAGSADGKLLVAWDDEREGNTDVMYSWQEGGEWGDDQPLTPAAGEGEQSHPAIAFDAKGNVHAAWVHRDAVGGPTRLRYAMGRLQPQ